MFQSFAYVLIIQPYCVILGATGEGGEIGNVVQNVEDSNGQGGTVMEDNAAEEEEDDIDWEEG